MEDATQSMRDYFYVLTLTALPVAIVVAITAALLGVPLAFTIGLVTFIFAYIPYIGALQADSFIITPASEGGDRREHREQQAGFEQAASSLVYHQANLHHAPVE